MKTHTPRTLLWLIFGFSLLLLGGCSTMPRMLGGAGGDATLNLDGEQKHELTLARGRSLVLDMRDPTGKGYTLAGAAFNTDHIRLEGMEQVEGRVRYQFTTLRSGDSDIQIKILKAGQRPEVFKFVSVKVD